MKNTIKSIMTNTAGKILATGICFFTLTLSAQDDETKIKTVILKFFDAFTKHDTVTMNGTVHAEFSLTTIADNREPVRIIHETKKDFFKIIGEPRKEKWIERIDNFRINIDGAYANAWCRYSFFVDTTFIHWGTDNFQLVREKGEWKILSISDTRRKILSEESLKVPTLPKDLLLLYDDTTLQREVNVILNNWHKAAAKADFKEFFGVMLNDCRYLGTDKTENWSKAEFEKFAKPYFDKGKAWDFKPYDRRIYFSDDKSLVYFDELLNTWMGVCRGSGVLKYVNGKYQLAHYNLAVTVANEKMKMFVKNKMDE